MFQKKLLKNSPAPNIITADIYLPHATLFVTVYCDEGMWTKINQKILQLKSNELAKPLQRNI